MSDSIARVAASNGNGCLMNLKWFSPEWKLVILNSDMLTHTAYVHKKYTQKKCVKLALFSLQMERNEFVDVQTKITTTNI